ncbi:MAG: transcriptional regulator [Phenylobacterium sp.]|nr:transcriptional regulator [Phenylobacterium sp.]
MHPCSLNPADVAAPVRAHLDGKAAFGDATAYRHSPSGPGFSPAVPHWQGAPSALLAPEGDTGWRSPPGEAPGAVPHAIAFGRFRLQTRNRELLADGAPVPLGSRAVEVLLVLIEAGGELVTKDELLSRVWPTTTVEENCLQFQISTLRKALGPDRDFIRTVSGRGYRFVAEIAVAACEPRTFGRGALSTNVPASTSDLIGRAVQLAEVQALVAANRLVTLVGAGGIGKTRLAIELARRLGAGFDGGVWIAELGPLSDPQLVLPTIASALQLGEAATSLEGLAAALGPQRRLLVLDNCEHMIGAAATVAEALLQANASLQVIATSRQPLKADGEWTYRVPPLDVPPEGVDDLDAALQHSAVKLFVARTRAAEPSTRFDSRTAAAAARICRRLDGIPLAIELAAVTAATLGVEGLASRVDDRLSLLTDGRRTAPARHQTLRATLDWSYELLSEVERAVMRRLAVFVGDFTMDEASAVAAKGDVAASDILPSVASLVTQSLVVRNEGRPVPRFRLLETMRAYAMDKLTESGEFETLATGCR